MKILACVLTFFLGTGFLASTGADEPAIRNDWQLPAAKNSFKALWTVPVRVNAGAFELKARLTLARQEGTAASVRINDDMNFGFDSRGGRFFVEGRRIGRTRALSPIDNTWRPGVPFDLLIRRTPHGRLTVSVADQVLCAVDDYLPDAVEFAFRPHRNTMTVHSLSLVSDQPLQRPPRLFVDCPVVPWIRGQSTTVAELTLNVQRPTRITGVDVNWSENTHPDIRRSAVLVRDRDGSLFLIGDAPQTGSPDERVSPLNGSEPLLLEPGRHTLGLRVHVPEDVSLSSRPSVKLEALVADGIRWAPEFGETAGRHSSARVGAALHRTGEFNCHTTRIPGVITTRLGTLLAVYDLRYNSRRDLQGHMDIGLSRSTDGGETWEAPRPIMDQGTWGDLPQEQNGCSDPNILQDPVTGRIFVSAVWTYGRPGTHQWRDDGSRPGLEPATTTQFLMVTSDDDGKTWSPPLNLTSTLKQPEWFLFAPAPGNGIALQDGQLVMPVQGRDRNGAPFSTIMSSADHGQSWTVGSPARSDTTECAVAPLSDGSLLLNMRDNRNRSDKSATNGRAMSVTNDLGVRWKRHSGDHSLLPEPVCMASMIAHRIGSQHLLLFSNPRDKSARRNMTVQLSRDDGQSWPEVNRILLDSRGGAYSSLTMIDKETIGILYESSQANLVFQRLPLSELMNE